MGDQSRSLVLDAKRLSASVAVAWVLGEMGSRNDIDSDGADLRAVVALVVRVAEYRNRHGGGLNLLRDIAQRRPFCAFTFPQPCPRGVEKRLFARNAIASTEC